MKPTLGLAVITNNGPEIKRLIEKYGQYFDRYFITVADTTKTCFTQLQHDFAGNDKMELSYFKTKPVVIDGKVVAPLQSFGKPRLFNQSQIKTDYWFWLDSDDEIDHPEHIAKLLAYAAQNHLDAMFLNYDYYQNEIGEQQANHWRERLIRTEGPYQWADVPCHETVIAPEAHVENSDLVSVRHHKTTEQMIASMQRNKVLLEADWKKTKDPRDAFYLGMTYEYEKRYDDAIKMYAYLIDKGGWDEQKVIAWNHIADCHYFQGDYEKALVATNMAIHLDPAHPDAYYQKILIYSAGNQLDKAVEWSEVAMTKKPKLETMQLVDPTRYEYKGIFLAAQANLFLGRVQRAFELYQRVAQIAPHFLEQVNRETNTDWGRAFNESFHDLKAIEYIKYLVRYNQQYTGKNQKLFESLPERIFSDVRLNAERVMVYPPKKWPDNSLVIFVGRGIEPWGPDTLDQGMGGSEEAVIYLSREFAKLGWWVTVFCERDSEYTDYVHYQQEVEGTLCEVDQPIVYKPWTEFNPWDEFNALVVERIPTNARDIKAKVKLVDLHDTVPEELLTLVQDQVDRYMVKSPYHRSLYPSVPDEKFCIVGNAIVKEQFHEEAA